MRDLETIKKILFQSTWTPEKLRETREMLGLSQTNVADILGVSKATISHMELGYNANGASFTAYCIVLERLYAYSQGYLPSYRRIGGSQFIEFKV